MIDGFAGLLIILILGIVAILIMRAIGAWMLRIDEVIKYQKETNELLREWKEEQSSLPD